MEQSVLFTVFAWPPGDPQAGLGEGIPASQGLESTQPWEQQADEPCTLAAAWPGLPRITALSPALPNCSPPLLQLLPLHSPSPLCSLPLQISLQVASRSSSLGAHEQPEG
ncbi:excitatory amino acid transporter 2 [Platysternon megacephalum]|uniref:Excitatory amino acid transporter 2 n=1 Tax=Platysternon megacephalum TaxID=55544 RepID=A0A4D9DN83_9SAUR|nr:excitatory amino acid transporter 2 [Platysternon megacephalum]